MAKRILLIDDDDLLCAMLGDYLEMSGFAVARAADGQQGLALLAAGGFDLIVLDLIMPRMDGIRFLNQTATPGMALPPVLVLSASATAAVIEALDFPCVVGTLRKPVQPPVLLAAVAKALGTA